MTDYKLERKKKMFAIVGPACAKCGENDLRLLELHHTDRDGYTERIYLESDMFYWVIGKILHEHSRYMTLCGHCHRLLHRKDGGKGGAVIMTEQERDAILKHWGGILHEAKDPPEYIKDWIKQHPLER